ncbi:hypothetical protein FACS189459_2280 [Bacilli bacterium]|nr:hypothetical protein FACS189459_2280 [Bacilli bacterium]
MYMFDRISYTDIQREELKNLLKEYCEKSSENELVASRCEHEVNELEYTTYMSKHIGGIFNGRVISVNNFGIFVQLDILVEGFIKITNLGNDFYNYNEKSKTLIGAKTNKIITLGTKICVKTISANIITRKIEFELVNFCSW